MRCGVSPAATTQTLQGVALRPFPQPYHFKSDGSTASHVGHIEPLRISLDQLLYSIPLAYRSNLDGDPNGIVSEARPLGSCAHRK